MSDTVSDILLCDTVSDIPTETLSDRYSEEYVEFCSV